MSPWLLHDTDTKPPARKKGFTACRSLFESIAKNYPNRKNTPIFTILFSLYSFLGVTGVTGVTSLIFIEFICYTLFFLGVTGVTDFSYAIDFKHVTPVTLYIAPV
ncbi:TPA: hypothetical protein NQM72_000459 [Salmonella enterica]|nr:hypothetical protein [Salmonella enterica]